MRELFQKVGGSVGGPKELLHAPTNAEPRTKHLEEPKWHQNIYENMKAPTQSGTYASMVDVALKCILKNTCSMSMIRCSLNLQREGCGSGVAAKSSLENGGAALHAVGPFLCCVADDVVVALCTEGRTWRKIR